MKHFFPALLGAACFSAFLQAAPYTGRVFVDKNSNGRFDAGEQTLRDVSVSDGLHVVKTAADGSFTLPGHPRERFIFITTPSGYLTENRHYLPVDPSTDSYDFGVRPYPGRIAKDGSHRYIHISDTEIFNTENQEDWADNVRDYVANEGAAFIIHTGDICYEKGLKNHIRLMNTANMKCPVFYCIGNHDLVDGKYGEELFESLYGPVYYSFDAGKVHYIVTPMAGGDRQPGYTQEDVYRWLKNDLAQIPAGTPVVVFNHDLLTEGDEFVFKGGDDRRIDLGAYNLKAWVYGHWHIHYMKKQGSVTTVSTATLDKGGIDHSTSAFRVLHVDQNGDFRSELRYTYCEPAVTIVAPAEGKAAVQVPGAVPLTVNTYASVSPVKEITYVCLAGDKPVASGKKWRQMTDWCWQTEIPVPSRLAGDSLRVRVNVRFGDGRVAETERLFIYEPLRPAVRLTGDWTNLGGNPAHTGRAASTLTPPLRMAWTTNVGANLYMTSPLVRNGKIYVASVDENLKGEAHVYALDGQTGSLLWKYPVRNSIKNTIATDSGQVFAQDAEGWLYAIDAGTGRLSWEKKLPVKGLPALIDGLVADKGIVYAGTGKGLCAFAARTGDRLWQNEGWNQGEGTTSTLTLHEGCLVGSAQWSGLYMNDAVTGAMKWKLDKDGLRNRGASPAAHGSLLYIVSDRSLFVLETKTGRVIVRKPLPWSVDVTSTPLLTEEAIIFGSAAEGLVALDRETLETKWRFRTSDALVYTAPYTRGPAATIETSPVLAGQTVYVGASDGTVYAVSASDGKLLWKHAAGAPVFGSVAVSGNALITTDFGGNVSLFTEDE